MLVIFPETTLQMLQGNSAMVAEWTGSSTACTVATAATKDTQRTVLDKVNRRGQTTLETVGTATIGHRRQRNRYPEIYCFGRG